MKTCARGWKPSKETRLVAIVVVSLASVVFACVVPGQQPSDSSAPTTELTTEQVQIAIQQICPVTGEKLGAHGSPVKAVVGEQQQEVYLCCAACAERELDEKFWATIHQNFAAAQQVCPIMSKPLPAGAKWTVVQGRLIYVCCPPCIEDIQASPAAALDAVLTKYRATLEARNHGVHETRR